MVMRGRRGGGEGSAEETPSHVRREPGTPARVIFALSLLERARGLLGHSPSWLGAGGLLVLAPCRSVHTFGMKHPLDIAFIDGGGHVLKALSGMPPRRMAGCHDARIVIERFSSPCNGRWFEVGEELGIAALDVHGDTQKEVGALPCT